MKCSSSIARSFAQGIVVRKHRSGELLGDKAHLASRHHVVLIEVPASDGYQPPDRVETLRDADQADRVHRTTDSDVHSKIVSSGGFGYLRNVLLCGFKIGGRDLIGKRQVLRAARINHLRQHQVRTHALDFRNNVAFARQRDCDHQNDACAPDDDAQHCEHGAHFVRAQSLHRKL